MHGSATHAAYVASAGPLAPKSAHGRVEDQEHDDAVLARVDVGDGLTAGQQVDERVELFVEPGGDAVAERGEQQPADGQQRSSASTPSQVARCAFRVACAETARGGESGWRPLDRSEVKMADPVVGLLTSMALTALVRRPEGLNDDLALGARAVELDHEDALPWPSSSSPSATGTISLAAEHQLLAMGVAVGALVVVHVDGAHPKIVVPIVRLGGRGALQELEQVFEQQWLVLLNTDSRGGVARKNVDHALAQSGDAHELGDRIRDVQELDGLVSLEHQAPEL